MIPQPTLHSFFDEMEKISSLMLNAGTPIKFTARAANWFKGGIGHAGQTLKTMATDPVGGFKRGLGSLKKDLSTGKPGTQALQKGLFALSTGGEIYNTAKKEDPTGQGRSRLARGAQAVGSFAGSTIGAPFGLSGSLVGGLAGETAGRMVGKGIDRLRSRNKIPIQPNQMVEPPRTTQ
jgi:hypothetical protein